MKVNWLSVRREDLLMTPGPFILATLAWPRRSEA
jgi:hypothetical protein